jgi:hypothetical protein
VAIIERYGFLGGNVASSIMPCWHGIRGHHSGLLTRFGEQVEQFGVGPIPLKDQHIEPEVVKILFLDMALEAGADLHLHNFIVGVTKEGSRIKSVITESKSGRRAFAAKIFVDASGDGDLCYHAGADYMKGADGQTQAMSLRFRIGFIDFDRFADWAEKHPEYNLGKDLRQAAERDKKKDCRRGLYIGSRLDQMYDKHRDRYPDLPSNTYFNCSSIRPRELSVNTTRIYDIDGTEADDLTKAEIVTRKQAWEVWRFLRDNVAGFEESVIVETAPQVGVRESRCIVGDYVLTVRDGAANRQFQDSVQTCRVSLDAHDKKKYLVGDAGGLVSGGVVDVPYRCFLPKGLEGVLVVGRCASSDHLMNSGFRRMENVFQSGEVGGTAAGMAVKTGTTPRQLPVEELQAELEKQGLETSQRKRGG